jgi:hypothetical protein
MASPICLNGNPKIAPRVPALMVIVENVFGALCVQAAERLLPNVPVSKTAPSDLGDALVAHHPGIVVWPCQESLSRAATLRADIWTRAKKTMFLPILATANQLLVGPLFGRQLSCASCWALRQSSLGRNGDVHEDLPRTTPLNTSPQPRLATLAITGMSLLLRKGAPLTSPYFLYNMHSRQLSHGVLTSTHECETCRRHLRNIDGPNARLRQFIHAHIKASESTGETRS